MYLMIIYLILAIFFGWIVLLSWLVWRTRRHYFNLISKTKKQKIDEILDNLIADEKKITIELEKIKRQLQEEINKSRFHLQRIGLVRFNPFERGGEQSFAIALLDGEKNGLVINFIYTREGLRTYTKKIKNGKGEGYELSEEEKKAIEKSN